MIWSMEEIFFYQPVKGLKDLRAYDNIQKIATGQRDDYITDSLPDYPYFKEYCNLIAIDLTKEQMLIQRQCNKFI